MEESNAYLLRSQLPRWEVAKGVTTYNASARGLPHLVFVTEVYVQKILKKKSKS